MNSEDLELEMANYINDMAQTLIKANITLPTGELQSTLRFTDPHPNPDPNPDST